MFERDVLHTNMEYKKASPEQNNKKILWNSKAVLIIIALIIIIMISIIVFIAIYSFSQTCEIGPNEKCLSCAPINSKICGKCNEYYELKNGKCYEINYTFRSIYYVNGSSNFKLINSSFLKDIELLRIDDKILDIPISEYSESKIIYNQTYYVYFILKNKEYYSFEKMFQNTDIIKFEISPKFRPKKVLSTVSMFENSLLEEIILNNFDTSEIINMESMFRETSLKDASFFSNLNFNKVINMNYMFYRTRISEFKIMNVKFKHLETMNGFLSSNLDLKNVIIHNFTARHLENMNEMFSLNPKLKYIEIDIFKTPNLQNIRKMFAYCESLKSFDLSVFKKNSIKDISHLFFYCSSLKSISFVNTTFHNLTDMSNLFAYSGIENFDLNSINTSKVINMKGMFTGTKATNIDLSNFNTENVKNMNNMFYNSKITYMNISNFKFKENTKLLNMFYKCKQLTTLDIRTLKYKNKDFSNYFFPISKKGALYINKSFKEHLGSGFKDWNITFID